MKKETLNEKWIAVADAHHIPLNEGKRVVWGSYEVALFNLGDEYCAIDNRCPHKSGPLSDGIVAGKTVYCPLHNWKINIENGCALSGGKGQVRVYPVKVVEGKIWVDFQQGKFREAVPSADKIAVGAAELD